MGIAVSTMGAWAVGSITAIGIGGYITAARGRRSAILMAGARNRCLAVVVRWARAQLCRQSTLRHENPRDESLSRTVLHLSRKGGLTLGRGRLFSCTDLRLQSVGILALVYDPGVARQFRAGEVHVESFGGGRLELAEWSGVWSRLSRRDARWCAWLPAIACGLAAPVCFVVIQTVCGDSRRTMASVLARCAGKLFGSCLGPVMAGGLSDAFGSVYGFEGIRYSLISTTHFLLPAAATSHRAERMLS
jgi:hypothetical protein